MKLTHIKVVGLFNLFDYSIPLDNEENLSIITGPNGYGKTMLLNIIYSFFNQDIHFFRKLVFSEIAISISSKIEFKILKSETYGIEFCYASEDFDGIRTDDRYKEWRADNLITTHRGTNVNRVIHMAFYHLFEDNFFLYEIKPHLIKEQRLLKLSDVEDDEWRRLTPVKELVNIVSEFAKELRNALTTTLKSSLAISQELDSSFPKRLLNEAEVLGKDEFNKRFSQLKEKQEKLKKYGLTESEQEIPEYNLADAKVLFVYLKDSEKKIEIFDELVLKLETFTSILNERRFAFKTIKIDKEKGFYFQTDKGELLELTDLSSGEQHEVVLLFELIFRANPNTLVLIDEPELSLHVSWQREFLNDILRIMAFQKMQVIIATHSPQIINDRWDLVYNLEKIPA